MPAEPGAEPPKPVSRAPATASKAPSPSIAPLIFAAIFGFAAGDALRPPERQTFARLALAGIDAYRATVSPTLAESGIVRCRFTPTCSAYGREAIARYGSPKGFVLAAGRILRCHPWAKGGEDPVP